MSRRQFLQAEFDDIVEEALAEVPQRFLDLLENVAVVVAEEPNDEDLEIGDVEDESELLGIFRGVPLTEKNHQDLPDMPTEIAIFRGPLLRVCRTREELIEEIRDTVIHELGHYFGLDDDEMEY